MTQHPVSESIRRRIISSLFITQSLFSAALIASFTIMSLNAVELSGSESAAGVPVTVGLLTRAATAYPFGWLMDRFGRRMGLSLGYALGAVGMVIAALSIGWGSFWGLCLGAALSGMGRGSAEQSRFVAAEVETAGKRAKVIGLIVFAGTVGSIAGPQLIAPASYMAEQYGLTSAMGTYFLAAILLFLCVPVMLFFLRPDPLSLSRLVTASEKQTASETQAEAPSETPLRSLRQIFSRPEVVLAVASMSISQLVMTAIMVITPLHMEHSAHTIGNISNVITAHTLGMFGLAMVTGRLVDRFGRIPIIVLGSYLIILATFIAPTSFGVWFSAIGLFLLGLGWNFCFVAGSSLLSDALFSGERGKVQGINEMLIALASAVGSLGTGIVFDWQGMTAVGVAGLAFTLLLLGIALWPGTRNLKSQRMVQNVMEER
jgi:MFS family permease